MIIHKFICDLMIILTYLLTLVQSGQAVPGNFALLSFLLIDTTQLYVGRPARCANCCSSVL